MDLLISFRLQGYCDVDNASDKVERKSPNDTHRWKSGLIDECPLFSLSYIVCGVSQVIINMNS